MQEFIYYNPKGIDFPLPESIFVTEKLTNNSKSNYIVSNTKNTNSEIVANEIDFYIRNSQDTLPSKIKNVEKLYEINAIKFDLAQDIPYEQKVSNKLLLVCNNEQKKEILKAINLDEFDLFHINEEIVKAIKGHIGNLSVIVDDEGKEVVLNVDQIIWFDQKDIACKQSGSFDPLKSSIDDVIEKIRQNIKKYQYKKFITYDSSICQYHERREEICGKCEEVCPTVAIVKNDEIKHLEFSQIDCLGCGGCISVCPSGAIDYAPSNKESLFEISKFYKDHIPLIIPEKMNISQLNIELKQNVLPFAIDGEKFLHETSLLTLLQESGSQVIFYSDFLSKGTKDAISILNQIHQKKYNKDAVIVAMNESELKNILEDISFVENSRFTIGHSGSRKREIFSIRLEHLIGEDDLGTIKTGEHIHYAKVNVNQDNCTLCLACVGACNVDALIANEEDFTLRLNPSLCTACGYCEPSCPEKDCLTIQRDVIHLNKRWFTEEVLAQDELYPCIECGKEFATKKAVEKIAAMMGPLFASNPTKHRTLFACEDCKAKLMIKQGLLDA